ncbi:MAG TPA: hypothetical protein VGF36_09040 [Rhodopila sp.]|jgi:hypothetical protein
MATTPSPPSGVANWPTLDEQLAAAKVIHGSALEKLITENQDFSVLRLEEAHDDLDLPPWIRVYWRRLHPDGRYSANDPTGGYPLSLRDTWQAMLRDQDWPARIPQPPPPRRQP